MFFLLSSGSCWSSFQFSVLFCGVSFVFCLSSPGVLWGQCCQCLWIVLYAFHNVYSIIVNILKVSWTYCIQLRMDTIKGCFGHIDSVISMKMKMCTLTTYTGRCMITKVHPDFSQMIEKIGVNCVFRKLCICINSGISLTNFT